MHALGPAVSRFSERIATKSRTIGSWAFSPAYGSMGATSLVTDAILAALEAVLSENISSCESSELPAVSRGEFGGYASRGGERGRGYAPTLTLKLRQAIREASHSTGIVFLIFSGYLRRPDAIASFATARDEEERLLRRSRR
jgi:hypothetical protein